MSTMIKDGGPVFPVFITAGDASVDDVKRAVDAAGAVGLSVRDAMAMSVRIPDGYSVKWGEVLIGEQYPHDVEPASLRIDWWMRVEAAYRYRMADAMLAARESES